MKTRSIKPEEVIESWFLVDATGVRLGKLAAKVASVLIGKEDVNRVAYHTPKNKVVVVNSKKIDIHPRKVIQKKYYRHSGFPGGFKSREYGDFQTERPNKVIELAIKGMLPKTKQGDEIFTNLFVYEEAEHKHEAQKPQKLVI